MAGLLGVDPSTAYRWAQAGMFAFVKVGRLIRVARADLEAFLIQRRESPPEEQSASIRRIVNSLPAPRGTSSDEEALIEEGKKMLANRSK